MSTAEQMASPAVEAMKRGVVRLTARSAGSAAAGYEAVFQSPSAWVTRVAVCRLRDHQRSLRRRASALLRLGRKSSPAPPAETLAGSLAVALRRLPMRQRLAVVLYYLDDRSIADVAAIMGCGEGTVNRYLFRARTTLRALLEAE